MTRMCSSIHESGGTRKYLSGSEDKYQFLLPVSRGSDRVVVLRLNVTIDVRCTQADDRP